MTTGSGCEAQAKAAPALAVIVVIGNRRHHARRMLADLHAQSARDALEAVLVDTAAGAGPIAGPDGLRVTVVPHEGDGEGSYARSRIAGLAHTRAPVVAFLEDHCFPAPGWADAVIAAHREPWAAVSYRITNANPESCVRAARPRAHTLAGRARRLERLARRGARQLRAHAAAADRGSGRLGRG
jgi:hypothetical protein